MNANATQAILATSLSDWRIGGATLGYHVREHRFMLMNIGLCIGLRIVCEKPPDRVRLTDLNNFMRVNVSGSKLARHPLGGWMVPLARSETNLDGALFLNVVNAVAVLTLEAPAPGEVTIWQQGFRILPVHHAGSMRGMPVLPALSLSRVRLITDERDDVVSTWAVYGERPIL